MPLPTSAGQASVPDYPMALVTPQGRVKVLNAVPDLRSRRCSCREQCVGDRVGAPGRGALSGGDVAVAGQPGDVGGGVAQCGHQLGPGAEPDPRGVLTLGDV